LVAEVEDDVIDEQPGLGRGALRIHRVHDDAFEGFYPELLRLLPAQTAAVGPEVAGFRFDALVVGAHAAFRVDGVRLLAHALLAAGAFRARRSAGEDRNALEELIRFVLAAAGEGMARHAGGGDAR